jgi:hypothetical protein
MHRPRLHSRAIQARLAVLFSLAAIALLALAPAASADIGETIILRCTHGQSLSGFSQSAYDQALKEIAADTEEYSGCSQQIRQAQLAAAGRHSGAIGSEAAPVPIAPTPEQQKAITHATHAGSAPVQVGGQLVRPGVVHASIASALSSLPTPLIATLALLLACLLAIGGGALRNRVRARRSH